VPDDHQLGRPGDVSHALSMPAGSDTVGLWTHRRESGRKADPERRHLGRRRPGRTDLAERLGGTQLEPDTGRLDYLRLHPGGTYMLRVQRAASATPSNAVELSAKWGAADPVVPAVVSTFNATGTVSNGAPQSFQFELTEPGLWYIDHTRSLDYYSYYYQHAVITDANGAVVASDYRQAALLPAGVYTLTISQDASTPSVPFNFALRRLDTDAIPSLNYGQPSTYTVYQTTAATIYRVDAAAGDVVQLNVLSTSGSPSLNWSLVNRYGQVVYNRTGANSDSTGFALPDNGPYYLVLENGSLWHAIRRHGIIPAR
jgi:hypothetical protein